jgi:5-methylcytosine-specific restriction endonuclease McrA
MGYKAIEYLTYEEYLQTDHWRQVRAAALWLADYRCSLCGSNENLEVHHNNYDCLYHERPVDLFVLCDRCHRLFSEAEIIGNDNLEKITPVLSTGVATCGGRICK